MNKDNLDKWITGNYGEDQFENKMKYCVLCGKEFYGWGNNPSPLQDNGECCDECNINIVVPTRLNIFTNKGGKTK